MKILAAVLALALVFVILPAIYMTFILCRHRNPEDFDRHPEEMDKTSYRPLKEEILRDIAWMRGLEHREVSIRGPDGITLTGIWYPGGDKTILLAHGYKATPLNNFAGIGRVFHEAGWNLLMINERGHGASEGLTSLGVLEAGDLLKWAEWADAETGGQPLVVYGISMGAAAVNYASSGPWPGSVRALISDCGYTCVYTMMKDLKQAVNVPRKILCPFMRVFVKFLLKTDVRKDGAECLKQAAVPMFFLGGGADRSVPEKKVREAYEACGSRKALRIVEGAPHTLAFCVGGEPVKEEIFRFIESSLPT